MSNSRHRVARARARLGDSSNVGPRSAGAEAGQAIAELALVFPILALLLVSVLQFAFIFTAQVGLTNATREVARSASAVPVADSASASTAAQTFYDRLTNSTDGFLKRNVGVYNTSALVTSGAARTRVCFYSAIDPAGDPSIVASVEVQYRHPIFLPLVSEILGSAFQLGARSDIRVSNPPLSSAGGIGDSSAPVCNA